MDSNFKLRQVEKTQDDFDRLVQLLITFAQEHKMGKLGAENFNLEKSIVWIANGIENGAWVVENDEAMIGTIALQLTSPWYSHQPYFTDAWLYVLPEYRNSKVASALLAAVQIFAEEKNLPLVVNIFNAEDTESKIQMMQRKGFKLIGASFVSGE
jgi:GNAT superfamily N-acetyltransferase